MNNDLEQFSEERLKELVSTPDKYDHRYTCNMLNGDESRALARIALSVRQAKPFRYMAEWSSQYGGMECDYSEVRSEMEDVAAEHDGSVIDLFTTPQPAHIEQVKSPMQPLHIDQFGTIRFKVNPIVQHLLDVAGNVGVNMNTIAMQGFEPEDQMQFAQLIGYSLSGYGELSYVTDESYDRASAAAPKPEM